MPKKSCRSPRAIKVRTAQCMPGNASGYFYLPCIMQHWELLFFFAAIAFIYSSVGFGGASSYLSILSLYHFAVPEMKLTALVCNIIVVTGSSILFIRSKQLDFRKLLPIVAVSVPMAYLGGKLKISDNVFFIVLGISLLAAAALLWIKPGGSEYAKGANNGNYIKDGLTGGAIGFLSGMVGIGGGIFLAPVLNLMKWDTPKKIAATAAVFILVNSISGIVGQLSKSAGQVNYMQAGLLGLAVFAGGQAGARIGLKKLNAIAIRRVTALLVFAAGVEVLYKHLP